MNFNLGNIEFANFWVLYLIPLAVALFVLWFFFRYKKEHATITLPTLQYFKNEKALRGRFKAILPFLRLLAIISILVVIARPQETNSDEKVKTYGIDIVFAFDISSSMLAQDFKPDRLSVAKETAINFMDARSNDRFGLIIFSGESYPQVPITSDRLMLKDQLEKVKNGVLTDGTAIGMGIGSATNRLVASDAKSKVIILMTDGENNAGVIDPMTAAEAALQYGIKVYTIGIGSKGTAYMPAYKLPNGQIQYDYMPVEIDEELLTEIADLTGGKYFRADSEKALQNIYDEIDTLEKTEIESSQTFRVAEKFHLFALLAFIFVCLEVLLKFTILRSFP